jgi:hypothetical protein
MRARPILSNIPWIAASGMLLVAVFSNLDLDVFFTSDTLYLPCLYRDFTAYHSLDGWHLNPAPNFFPDMLFYFLLMAFSGGNLLIASFVFAVAQYFAILLLLRYIFKLALPGAPLWYHHLTCLLLSLPLLELFFPSYDPYYAFYLASNSFHTGAFTMGLACLALTLRYLSAPRKGLLYGLFALITLSVLSDKLFIVLYAIPTLITLACLFKTTGLKSAVRIAGVSAVAVFAGLFIFNNIDKKTGFHFDRPHKMLDASEIRNSCAVMMMQMRDYFSKPGFRALSLYLFAAALIIACVICARLLRRKEGTAFAFFMLFFIVYSIVVWLAPVLNGSYAGNDCIRYNIYPVYLAAVTIPLMIAYGAKNRPSWTKARIACMAAGFSLLLFCTAAFCTRSEGLKDYFSYYPAMARRVDSIAGKEHLANGLGDYWQAKKITMFSKKGVKVRAVFDDLAIWNHVANDHWFYDPGVTYDFILLNGFQDTGLYRKRVHPLAIIRDGEAAIVKTRPFYYHTGGYLPVNYGDAK